MIQPIITRAESRKARALDKTSLRAKEGGGSWKHTDGKFRGAGRSPVERRAGAKKQADGDGGGGLGKLSAAAPSAGVASPALAGSSCRAREPAHTDTSRPARSLPHQAQNPPPLASRNTRKGFERRDGRRERRSRATSAPAFVLLSLPVSLRHPHAESRLTMRGELA
jgi:hypothetical protein